MYDILQNNNILFLILSYYNIRGGSAMGFKVNPEMPKAEPSLNRTIRLKEGLINKIQGIADKNNISFNFLVTQMLEYCIEDIEKE